MTALEYLADMLPLLLFAGLLVVGLGRAVLDIRDERRARRRSAGDMWQGRT